MQREMASKFEPDSDYTNVRELTIQNTNEVAWEHYTAMRDISSLTLKDGNYNVEDVMKSIMDTYETRYSSFKPSFPVIMMTCTLSWKTRNLINLKPVLNLSLYVLH